MDDIKIVMVSRSQSVYHGGTKPNCPACGGKGWHEWPDGFAVKCSTCGGWGTAKVDDEDEVPYWECPYYRQLGEPGTHGPNTCIFGCHEEPACITGGPWPGQPPPASNVG